MTNGNGDSTTETGQDVKGFVALLREFVSSDVGVLPGPTPIEKPATITTPTGTLSVGSIAGFEVGHVLIVDSGANEERFVVEEIDGTNCRVRPLGKSNVRGWRVLRRWLLTSLRRFRSGRLR